MKKTLVSLAVIGSFALAACSHSDKNDNAAASAASAANAAACQNPAYTTAIQTQFKQALATAQQQALRSGNGEYIDALAALGFGFVEIGTVTPRPQDGNPQPRLFRLPEQQAIINRMGFNNHGIDAAIRNIEKSAYRGILGINIGKNAVTPIENADDDYLICLEKAYAHADYITVNISSPNTKNLRALQGGDELTALLTALKDKQAQLAVSHGRYVPLAVKIAPDLDETQIADIAHVVQNVEMDGIIATNTTIDKTALGNHPLAQEQGGLSGLPVREKSNLVLRRLAEILGSTVPIIGVGGIVCGEDAAEKLRLGATAVQLYSGLIYQGPELVRECMDSCR